MIDQDDAGFIPALPFASTGPQGHRGRMRERLLNRGPDGLADYELLEMLLFLGIPRRDTKPLAKTVINRFGDLRRSLTAPAAELRGSGLEPPAVGLFALAREAARRLADAQATSRPLLSDMARLLAYLDLPARLRRPPHLAVLLVNNRNQLLAELPCPEARDAAEIAEAVAKRALETNATALLLATCRPGAAPAANPRDLDLTRRIGRAAAVLGIALHDHMIFGAGETASLKRQGRL